MAGFSSDKWTFPSSEVKKYINYVRGFSTCTSYINLCGCSANTGEEDSYRDVLMLTFNACHYFNAIQGFKQIIFIISIFLQFYWHSSTIYIYIATLSILQSLKESKEKNWKKDKVDYVYHFSLISRFSRMNRIFAGLCFGKGKPHFPTFLQPFALSLRALYNPGNK